MTTKVEIYTTALCGYCHRAKRLLREKGVAFTEIDVGFDPEKRREMERRSGGGRTVPQIFVNGELLGGAEELAALDREGRLDPLLEAAG